MAEQRIVSEIAIDENDIQLHNKKRSGRCVFLCAGRLIYRKGHEVLLDALERLPADVDYECRIVGDGPELKRLRNRSDSSTKLKGHVVFTGAIPFVEMSREYNNADVFVMPSIRETTGSVLLEAMSKGIPVITIGKFGGATLLDSETGWLYDGTTKDDFVESLEKAIMECIVHPDEIERKGRNARVKSERYTWDAKMEHYNQIYYKLVTG